MDSPAAETAPDAVPDVATADTVDAAPGPVAGTIVRTLAYHQVSAVASNVTAPAVISADGSRIAYPIAPGTGDIATPNRIFVVNPDGTGTLEVDSYKSNCFCGSKVVISGDGRTVVSTDSTQVHVVGADASKKGVLLFDSNEISDIAVTADGATTYMLQRRDNKITNGAATPRGLWAVNADGSNHRQILSMEAIATLMATTPDKVFPFAGCGKSLEVAASGQRGVVAVEILGVGQLVFAFEGSTPRKLAGPFQFVKQVAISSDGLRVAISTVQANVEDISVMNFDGSGARSITTQSQGSCFSPLTLNADGSQLLAGDTGTLFPTAGGDPVGLLILAAGDGIAIGGPWRDTVSSMSMTGSGRRFAYRTFDEGNILQIGLLEIDPASPAPGPGVSAPTFSMGTIVRGTGVGARVTCRVAGTVLRTGTATFIKGIEDTAGNNVSGKIPLRDDGLMGDTTANDGLFVSTDAIASSTAGEVGPRIVRFKAEAKATDGKRHATAIDVSGLDVK